MGLPNIELAAMLPGAKPLAERGINETFTGLIRTVDGRNVSAFIKDLDPRQLVNELVAATVGLNLGLPIPKPYLVLDTKGFIPATMAPHWPKPKGRVMFASERKGVPPLGQLLAGGAATRTIERLKAWVQGGSAFAFDTWVANIDRHMGNLLFDGDDEVWLIDHGHAFTGPTWKSSDLKAPESFRNAMAEWLTPLLSADERDKMVKGCNHFENAASALNSEDAVEAARVKHFLKSGELGALVAFLTDRCKHIALLASSAAGVPKLV